MPYTPETKYVKPKEIPKANWQKNDVGIRRNNDYDNGGATRDSEISDTIAEENDLIQTEILVTAVPGVKYVLRNENSDLKFWNSSTKGTEYVFTDGEYELNSSRTMYAEYCGTGDDKFTVTLVAMSEKTGEALFTREIVYRPFNSVTAAFVGENQTAGNATLSPGINNFVIDELLNGYDVHVFDDGHDIFGADEADEWGRGSAYDMLVNALNNHGQSNVALAGYSHGGGTVYNVAWRLHNNYADTNGNTVAQPYKLVFTSYIDAIYNDSFFNPTGEYRRPLGSMFHVNQYQDNDWLSGCPSDGDDDINRTYLGEGHTLFSSHPIVLGFLKMRFEQKVER